jgi:hypothetical protein
LQFHGIVFVELPEYKNVTLELFDITGQLIHLTVLKKGKTAGNRKSRYRNVFLEIDWSGWSTVKRIIKN